MVTALIANSNQRRPQNPKRLRSDSGNAPSRYLLLSTSSNSSSSTNTTSSSGSSTPTRRSQTPTITAATPLSSVKERAVSAGRRRPTAAKTIRSLSVSFQGDSFPLPSRRKAGVTPARENTRPKQHRLDCGKGKLNGSGKLSKSNLLNHEKNRLGRKLGPSKNDDIICSTPSMLGFAADVRRRKLGENRIADAHDLRILHNRQLQWGLANVRVENALLLQEHAAERTIYNAWVSMSKLRHSVKSKRTQLQLLTHKLNLYSVLKEQDLHLANWDQIDRDHRNSLCGIINALEASTIRLPVVSGARADVRKMQEAIASAVDVMQTMAYSLCSLLTKVEQTNSLVSELSNLSVKESDLLDDIKDYLLTTFIPLQVRSCSLRTHVMCCNFQEPERR